MFLSLSSVVTTEIRSSSSVEVLALVDRLFPLESRDSEAFLVRKLLFWCTASLTRSMSVLRSDSWPELVCECEPMLWLLSSLRTLSNVGMLPFDLMLRIVPRVWSFSRLPRTSVSRCSFELPGIRPWTLRIWSPYTDLVGPFLVGVNVEFFPLAVRLLFVGGTNTIPPPAEDCGGRVEAILCPPIWSTLPQSFP